MQEEINEWMKICNKYQDTLSRLNLKCIYCDVSIDENTVNTLCEKNSTIDIHTGHPQHLVGNGRHNFMHISKATPLQEEEIFKEIRQKCSSLNINLEVMFKEYDKTLTVGETQAESIADNLFPEPDKRHLVDYNAFLRRIYLSTTKPLFNENFQDKFSDEENVQNKQNILGRKSIEKQENKQANKGQRTKELEIRQSKQIQSTSVSKTNLRYSQDKDTSLERRIKFQEEEKSSKKQNTQEDFEKKLREKYFIRAKDLKKEIQIFLDEDGTCSIDKFKVALYKAGLGLTNEEIQKAALLVPTKDGRVTYTDFVNLFQ